MTTAALSSIPDALAAWAAEAKAKLARGTFTPADVDALLDLARAAPAPPLRQRLLYLHAVTPSIASPLIGAALHEPVAGGVAQLDPRAAALPYASVHDAIRDGWQVVHFPQQIAPFEDREIDVLGYEFILQKLEPFHDDGPPAPGSPGEARPAYG